MREKTRGGRETGKNINETLHRRPKGKEQHILVEQEVAGVKSAMTVQRQRRR